MAHGKYERRRSRRKPTPNPIVILLTALFLTLALMLMFRACNPSEEAPTDVHTTGSTQTSIETTETTTVPTEPYIMSTASIGVTGDVLVHGPVLKSVLNADGEYDFTDIYTYIKEYFDSYDFMVANLEVTLGGTEAGKYRGYPTFNCPDSMIDALQGAGVDMLLTANNHSYDTGHKGFIRTQQVLDEKNMTYLGSRQSEDTPPYLIQDINGIRVGMLCYTYETGDTDDGRKTLNGIPMTFDDTPLISSFRYDDLDSFYTEVSDSLAAMDSQGVDATMVYIHWGNEYKLSPNTYQTTIAQQLCEMGVDVIVGGHPHVIQPFETLTASTGHKTYCIYSIGNAISNQRRTEISSSPNGHTEDGMIFGVEFEKWNDGTVNISEVSILPTWVNLQGGKYTIVPLDTAVEAWNGYQVNDISYPFTSYERTMSIVGAGLNAYREEAGLPVMPLTVE